MTYDGRIEAFFTVPSLVTIQATNPSGGPNSTFVPIGGYYPSDMGAQLQTSLNAFAGAGWTVSLSTGPSGTLRWTITCSTTPFSIAWGTDTTLRDLLGFTADIVAATTPQTGAKQGRGLWMPDSTVMMKSDPRAAPPQSDHRTTTSPTGIVLGLVGDFFYQHTNVVWSAVPKSRIWEGLATTPNASWEFFYSETQWGKGLDWFSVSSKLRIFDHTGQAIGNLGNLGAGVDGWQIVGVANVDPDLTQAPWTGLYKVTLPQLISAGS